MLFRSRGVIQYGFPSGHAQSVFYATSYLFAFDSIGLGMFGVWRDSFLVLAVLVCLLTLVQRFKYRRHSISQLFAGSMLGCIVGWSVFRVGELIRRRVLV